MSSAVEYFAGLSQGAAKAAAMLSERASKALVESARSAGFEGQAHYFDTTEEKLRDIRKNLESSSDWEKLDGLQRLTAMVSKGRNVSEFFPSVVKNVASTNMQVRKLVYIYLLRYAEQEPDLALLCINTFQRDLTDSSPLIRAMALRVMSGIRVPVICPIILLGIKKLSTDSSPYVRRTAARAIPKCYSLDPNLKDSLVEIIIDLLRDRSTLTIGSVITAFNEVCPQRLEIIDPYYRKLCLMLVDADEWGQIAIINLLKRYSRTRFLNPKSEHSNGPQQTASLSTGSRNDTPHNLDPDHELLLISCAPLLQSRNSAVVMAVASLYFHIAPNNSELNSPYGLHRVAKALVRLLRTHRDIEYVVLTNIAGICQQNASIFAPYLQHFYVRISDPVFIWKLKMEVLTLIASELNIGLLLQEFQEYVKSPIKDLSIAAVRCIGRVAQSVPEVAENCLRGLMHLTWNSKDMIASEALVTINSIVSTLPNPSTLVKYIRQLTHVLDAKQTGLSFKQAQGEEAEDEEEEKEELAKSKARAKSSLIALVGIHCQQLERIAPDVLRRAAVAFKAESTSVKLQTLTLAAKLSLSQPDCKPVQQLLHYVLNLARYDLVYDVRDRARFLRALVIANTPSSEPAQVEVDPMEDHTTGGWSSPPTSENFLKERASGILMCEKPVPVLKKSSAGRKNYTLGTLSITLNSKLPGYEPLPDWPTTQPDSTARNIGTYHQEDPNGAPPPSSVSNYQPTSFLPTQQFSSSASHGNRPKFSENLDEFYKSEDDISEDSSDLDEEESEEEDEEESSDEEEAGAEESGDDDTSDGYEAEERDTFFPTR